MQLSFYGPNKRCGLAIGKCAGSLGILRRCERIANGRRLACPPPSAAPLYFLEGRRNMTTHGQMIKKTILDILRESMHGTDEHGAFLSSGPNGMLDLLRELSAEEASLPISGASIATHAIHLSFSFEVYKEWIQGVRDSEYDWDKSWEKHDVSTAEWDTLLSRINRHHNDLEDAIRQHGEHDFEAMWGGVGALAHTAYHLGIIQVKIDELRKRCA